MQKKSFKQGCYQVVAAVGVKLLSSIFPEYFAHEPLAPTDRYIEYPFALSRLPKPPARVLDIGCAGSYFPLILASIGYEAYGIDIRSYSITDKIKHKNFEFRRESILNTSFPAGFFDAACAISTVEHLGLSGRYGAGDDSSADRKSMEEARRILKPNGIILLTIPFGKAKVIRPYSRIYDSSGVAGLAGGFIREEEKYFMQNSDNDWYECDAQEAGSIEATAGRYPLCLLKLRKPGTKGIATSQG
jgi:SAM-dependent methyltransferase